MHPAAGIGVQFTGQTSEAKSKVENFIHALTNSKGAVPQIEVRPDSIDNSPNAFSTTPSDESDPLLGLFHTGSDLTTDEFRAALHNQRFASEQVGI
jgi:hypothetical protein